MRTSMVLLACATTFYLSLTPVLGNDFWLHVVLGQRALRTHHLATTLEYPFTTLATATFNNHEWLSAILYALVHEYVGTNGLILVAGVLGVAFWLLLVRLAWHQARGNLPVILISSLVGLMLESYRHVLRPELLSLIVMGVYWILIEDFARAARRWHLPAMMLLVVLWTNLHGSFPLAVLLAGLYTVGAAIDSYRQHRSLRALVRGQTVRFATLTVLTALSTLINPFGMHLVQFALQFGTSDAIHPYITEWNSPFAPFWTRTLAFRLQVSLWAVLAAAAIATARNLRSVDWLLLACFTLLATRAVRFPVYLSFLAVLYLPRALRTWLPRLRNNRPSYMALGLLLCSMIGFFATYGTPLGLRPLEDTPDIKLSHPMEQILAAPTRRGNVLNSMELGAELIYLAYPRMRPVIDCRVDSYGLNYFWFMTQAVFQTAYFDTVIHHYDVRYILLMRAKFDDINAHVGWPPFEWNLVYADDIAVLMERVNAGRGSAQSYLH